MYIMNLEDIFLRAYLPHLKSSKHLKINKIKLAYVKCKCYNSVNCMLKSFLFKIKANPLLSFHCLQYLLKLETKYSLC